MAKRNPKILLIGSGPSVIGSENEADGALLQTVINLQRHRFVPIVIDNNAFSVTLTQLPPNQTILRPINYQNVVSAIQTIHPQAIIPTFGGYPAIHITQQLIQEGILAKYHVKLWGISQPALQTVGNPQAFVRIVRECHEKALTSYLVDSIQEAIGIAKQIGFPVVIKSLNPQHKLRRKICKDADRLETDLTRYLANSKIHQCLIEPNITGYQEFSLVSIRDRQNTEMVIAGLENVDAVGINPGDSIIVAPIQTLTDREYQTLRNATFRIMERLNISGFCDVQFAFDRTSKELFITKITPYFTREMDLAIQASGYPLLDVYAVLLRNKDVKDAALSPNYDSRIKLLEPSLDHVLVKMPIWPFEDIHNIDQHLGSLMQSVGSSVGIGRTVEEAFLKALRSSQFSPQDVLPNLASLSEDELIDQLIHPQASRILVIIEALRRHYLIHDLAELTKIQPFYFYKIKRLLTIEDRITAYPNSTQTIVTAHNNGFGNGMLAETWHQPLSQIHQLAKMAHSTPTYKQIEPSAGELIQNVHTFYSSYELENESKPLSGHSALVIGRGGNQLGPNTSADYYTSEILIQLHRLCFKTIIMNNNPNAVSLIPDLSDKQYVEPIQIGNITDIIHLERPQLIIIPGNRHFLLRQLKKRYPHQTIILPPDQKTGVQLPDRADLGLDFFVDQFTQHLIVPIKLIGSQHRLRYIHRLVTVHLPVTTVQLLKKKSSQIIRQSDWKGLVQVLFQSNPNGQYRWVGIRPLRTAETVFLNQITNVNWIRTLIQLYTHQLTPQKLQSDFEHLNIHYEQMVDNFPFHQLQVTVQHALISNNQAVGASIHRAESH